MFKQHTFLLMLAPLLITACEQPSQTEFDRTQMELMMAVGDESKNQPDKGLVWEGQIGLAKNLDSDITLYGRGTNNSLVLSQCYDSTAICFSTGALNLYDYKPSTTITGANECVDEWGVQLEVEVSYAELPNDITDIWQDYQSKPFLEGLAATDDRYTKQQVSSVIHTLDRHTIHKTVLATNIEKLDEYMQTLSTPELSKAINDTLVDSYNYPHHQSISKLNAKIAKDIQANFPEIKTARVTMKGFNVGGRVDDEPIVDNDNIKKSFSCQVDVDEPELI